MKQAHKKRPPRATANSPPALPADGGGKLLYKSEKILFSPSPDTLFETGLDWMKIIGNNLNDAN